MVLSLKDLMPHTKPSPPTPRPAVTRGFRNPSVLLPVPSAEMGGPTGWVSSICMFLGG